MENNVIIPCLEDLSDIEKRCNELGLSIYVNNRKTTKTAAESNGGPPQEITTSYEQEYEVGKIQDYKIHNGIHWYLVSWRGWSRHFDTWEPKENLLHCRKLIQSYHEQQNGSLKTKDSRKKRTLDVDRHSNSLKNLKKICESKAKKAKLKNQFFQSKKILKKSINGSHSLNAEVSKLFFKKLEVQKRLKEWEKEINRVSREEVPIVVKNLVDLEGPPENFTYINDNKAGEGIVIPDDPLVGCECEPNCYENRKQCCGHQSGGLHAYTKFKRVRVTRGSPIYECNRRCKCGDDCHNRVVQQGRKVKLSIFRTSNGRGWGVRALQKIKKDTFVMEYVGEVITNEEAEMRGKVYDAEGRTYLFDLDYNDGDCPFTVDAAHYGNVSHFMNHSCSPNLVVYVVWINTLDPRLPRIAFFAKRDIAKGEELTFDYMMSRETISGMPSSPAKPNVMETETDDNTYNRIECKCQSERCRKYLF